MYRPETGWSPDEQQAGTNHLAQMLVVFAAVIRTRA
jgi:hypothetical protein